MILMVKYINQFKDIKRAIEYLENRGYTICVRHDNDIILETGKSDILTRNTVGNIKIHYINALKLLGKTSIALLR